MIKYSTNLEGQDLLNPDILSLIDRAGQDSQNPVILITSLWRSPARQAKAMYDNISKGNIIPYLDPGRQVTVLCQKLLKEGQSEATILKAMENKIIELANENKMVSLHCVSKEAYLQKNVIDISISSANTPNPRNFVKTLMKDQRLLKVLTPFPSDYNDKRIVFSEDESAIHIEMDSSQIASPEIEEPEIEQPEPTQPEIQKPEQPEIVNPEPPKDVPKSFFVILLEFISKIVSRKW